MKLHKLLTLLLVTLALSSSLWPGILNASSQGADNGLDQKGIFHLPVLSAPATTGFLMNSDFGLAGSGTSVDLYQWGSSTPRVSIPVGERIVRLSSVYSWGTVGVSESGKLYTFAYNQAYQRGVVVAPPDGQLWTQADIELITSLEIYQYDKDPLLIKVGTQLYRVDGRTDNVTNWGPANVQHVLPYGTRMLVIVGTDSDYRIAMLNQDGEEMVSAPAANAPFLYESHVARSVYFLAPDRQTLREIDTYNNRIGALELRLPAPVDRYDIASDSQGRPVVMSVIGDQVLEYSVDTKQLRSSITLPEPGLVTYAPYSSSTIRYINGQGIFEYEGGNLTWAYPLKGLDTTVYFELGSQAFAVADDEGDLQVFSRAPYILRQASLMPGYGFILGGRSEGTIRLGLLADSLPDGLGLGYELYTIAQDGSEQSLGYGVLDRLTLFDEISAPVGSEVLLLLTPVPTDATTPSVAEAPLLQSVRFTFASSGLDLSGAPLELTVDAPGAAQEYWGRTASMDVKLRTAPYSPILFMGDENPEFSDETGYLHRSVMLSGELMDITGVFAVSESGYVTFASLAIVNHWLEARPSERIRPDGELVLSVPDAAVVDLSASTLQIAGVDCTLTLDPTGSKLIGRPESTLPLGLAQAQLILHAKTDVEDEAQLLDAVKWDIRVSSTRIAQLWIGKRSGMIEGVAYSLEAAPYVSVSRTMVPIRFVGDAMQARLGWNNSSKQASFELNGQKVVLTIGSRQATVNGKTVLLDAAPAIVNGRTFVPLRFVSENLGAKVDWQSSNKQITLTVE